ncbi:IS110 family transposase [Peribacillus huizhouensis]|uniref:Transposase n=1 Tax=Peribacillus huizhouensis TaxID=1501239 RepID=A0ABR6CXW7_9BACI|nr:IS110 family transposase [Peribacillus huizhouensis]MBA9029460.1 transposase [Peribacillus huizhouensis]
MPYVLAFDVSMGKSYFAIYASQKSCLSEGEIHHQRLGFEKLYEMIVDMTNETEELPAIVFEATGVYSTQLERFMNDHGFPYTLLNPLESKLQMAGMRIHKTDKSDAHQLARTHFTAERRVKAPQDSYFEEMRALSRYYAELEEDLAILRNRIHAMVQLSFPELEVLYKTKSELYYQLLCQYPHPSFVLAHSKTVLRNRILKSTDQNMSGRKAEERAYDLMEAANTCYPAISETDPRLDQLRDYTKRYLELVHQKEAVIKKMVNLSEERNEYGILTSIPGIGEITAVRLIAEIGDIKRFDNHKQLNAYAGIDIRRFESGTLFYKDKINKRGNKELRKILYNMVQNMIKMRRFGGNHFVEYYDKLKTQPYNKRHKVASIACVNKFLKVAFHLISHNLTYNYEIAVTHS